MRRDVARSPVALPWAYYAPTLRVLVHDIDYESIAHDMEPNADVLTFEREGRVHVLDTDVKLSFPPARFSAERLLGIEVGFGNFPLPVPYLAFLFDLVRYLRHPQGNEQCH